MVLCYSHAAATNLLTENYISLWKKKEEKTWEHWYIWADLIGMFILSYVGNIMLGALVMWLIKRNESSFIDNQGKGSP